MSSSCSQRVFTLDLKSFQSSLWSFSSLSFFSYIPQGAKPGMNGMGGNSGKGKFFFPNIGAKPPTEFIIFFT